MYLFFVALVLHCCMGSSLAAASLGYSLLRFASLSSLWLLSLRSAGSRAHGLPQLWHVGSVVAAPGLLEHRLNSWGTRAKLFGIMWDLPRSGI